MSKKAIILLSGGLDSATCLGLAKAQGFECYALTFEYGQRHRYEIKAAGRIAQSLGVVEHHIVPLPIDICKGSALTEQGAKIPDYLNSSEIPPTYVPARNTIFLSIALAYAEVIGASEIYIGSSSVDYSGYPDCRPEYFQAFQRLADLATKKAVEGERCLIKTPLMTLSKAKTIQTGNEVGVDYSLTVSCYQTNERGEACGRCESCHFRRKGFQEANVPDPTPYIQL